jgi:hypothetical protein
MIFGGYPHLGQTGTPIRSAAVRSSRAPRRSLDEISMRSGMPLDRSQ